MAQKHKQNIIYQAFRVYLRFFHDKVFYKKVHRIGLENIPEEGAPLLLACNHQNCLNDPLGLIFTFRDRKPHILARADVIEHNKFTNRFLRRIGLLPAFRMDFDGEESLSKNQATFNESETTLIDGNTIIMFPEAMHQDKRWLGNFSSGYTKIAFEAAELDNFQTEVFILPACNHYSNYFGIQNEMILKFAKPISIAPFYELYKTKPRTAQRQVNALVHEQINNLMLNITDLDNYEAIDFIRNIYGHKYATQNGLNATHFPNMLTSDKLLFKALDEAKALFPDKVSTLYAKTLEYKQLLNLFKITDTEVGIKHPTIKSVSNIISMILLFPFWLVSLWPNVFIYNASAPFVKRLKDKMFEGTIRYSLSVMLTIPLFYTLTFVLAIIFGNLIFAIIYTALLPSLGIFAWNYWQFAKRTAKCIRYSRINNNNLAQLQKLKNEITNNIESILYHD